MIMWTKIERRQCVTECKYNLTNKEKEISNKEKI
jgi:hypothetical protein